MKRSILIACLMVAFIPLSAVDQAAGQQPKSARPTRVSFSGKVREDGRAILVEGRAWVISNVEKLRDHAGETVSVKGLLDPLTSEIQIVSMKLIRPPVNTAARLGDSAFRR